MRRLLTLVLLVLGLLFGGAGAAHAQDPEDPGPTDFRSVLTTPSHPADGVTVRMIENGARMEVTNGSSEDLVVLGYVNEPFLRIGPEGVFENTQSPATELSRNRWGSAKEQNLNPTGTPQWHKVSGGTTARWYDHRTHWFVQQRLPDKVVQEPRSHYTVQTQAVPMRLGDRPMDAEVRLEWVPGPSPWPGIAAIGVLAVGTALLPWLPLLRRRTGFALKAFGAVVVTVGTGALLHLLLTAADRADGYVGAFFSGNLLQLLFVAVAVGGGVLLLRGKPAAAWIAGPGAAALGLHAVGYEIPVLWRSSAPFAGPIGLDRALAVLVPGLGVGVAVALVFMIRRSPVVLEEKVEEEPMFGRTKDSPVSRRRFIGATSAAGVGGLAVGGGAVALLSGSGDSDEAAALSLKHLGSATVPFHGDRQGGVVNPAQANTVFLAFDLEPGADKAKTAALMRRWSDAAARMSRGEVPDLDDQIATDSGPSSLTVTFGFGGSLFEKVGLADRRPAGLRDLPAFPGDAIDPARSGGDLSVQVCADDGLVTFHAVRVLQRLAKGTARVRWQMSGFSRTPGTETRPVTTRNLMGQVDGTGNPAVTEPDFDKKIFVAEGDGQPWLRGGTYVVMRRIRMLLDDWDGQDLAHQEKVIGRRKSDGGPLSGGPERTPIDYGARGPDGSLAIADNAHVRVSAPEFNRGATMLRRGYSYHDGFDATGVPDAGLLFIAYQHDPHEVFVPVQQKLARGDALSKFIRHESSAVFVVPPGCKPGGYVGQQLLEA